MEVIEKLDVELHTPLDENVVVKTVKARAANRPRLISYLHICKAGVTLTHPTSRLHDWLA